MANISAKLNIDQINIVLMIMSCAVAFAIPFELVLLSYAFLGPAHYLTEISWLHDRQYFTDSRWVWIPFVLFAILAVIMSRGALSDIPSVYYILAACLSLSAAIVLFKNFKPRILFGLSFMGLFTLLGQFYPPFVMGLAFLLPTILHIYVFTGLFIVTGALKNKTPWAWLSFIVFILCGLSFWFITPSSYMMSTTLIDRGLSFFDPLVDYIVQIVSFDGRVNPHSVLAFLSFAYTYHYLNWFSKTEIIKWNKIPKSRMTLICLLYISSIALYIIDYKIGFIVLTLLSLIHVLLEFPLNIISIRTIVLSFNFKNLNFFKK